MAYRERNINDFQEAKRARAPKKSRFSLLSDIQEQDVGSLWDGRFPTNGPTLLTGRGGLGKSTLCAERAACFTRGDFGRPMSVVILSAEDPVDSVLKKRLRAADANERLVATIGLDEHRPSITQGLLDDIASVSMAAPLGMVVFDGFCDFLLGVNYNDDAQLRPYFALLEPWQKKHRFVIVGIVHPNKTDPTGIAGTRAFRDCSRSVLVVESRPLPAHPKRVILVHDKSNWSALAPILAFEPGDGTIRWLPTVPEDRPGEDTAAAIRADLEGFEDAKEFLKHVLKGSPQLYSELVKDAAKLGIPARTLRHARKKLGVQSSQKGFGGTRQATWWLGGKDA